MKRYHQTMLRLVFVSSRGAKVTVPMPLRHIGDHETAVTAQQNLGRLYMIIGRYPECQATLDAALKQAEQFDMVEIKAYIFSTMAELAILQEQYDMAQKIIQKAIPLAQQQQDIFLITCFYMYAAEVLLNQNEPQEAEQRIKQALEMMEQKQLHMHKGRAFSVLGAIWDKIGHFEKAAEAHRTALKTLEDKDRFEFNQAQKRYAQHQSLIIES